MPSVIKQTALIKPFLLLAGISGTGKTRFVREQAAASGSIRETYCLVSVRPDWHEPSDLLGHVSRMSGQAEYVVTDVLRFMVRAWKEIRPTVEVADNGQAFWSARSLNSIRPYWLCLDEMNLAPVEQYFADYLSVLETRKWSMDGQDGLQYACDPLLKPCVIEHLPSSDALAKALGLDLNQADDEALWLLFKQYGIPLPFNLMVAGTVNMDETTHGFSRKVIDRAITLDFGDFFPNDFDQFFNSHTVNTVLTYPIWSDGRDLDSLKKTYDKAGALSVRFLKAVNTVLDGSPFKLGYRALNELLLSVIAAQPNNEYDLLAVWDDFVMTKILPRIEGDADKLSEDNHVETSLLHKLITVLEVQFYKIWEGASRPDLYRTYSVDQVVAPPHSQVAHPANSLSRTVWIPCRSKQKLEWMQKRLLTATFTSFWP